jgi:hypothetical protein
MPNVPAIGKVKLSSTANVQRIDLYAQKDFYSSTWVFPIRVKCI